MKVVYQDPPHTHRVGWFDRFADLVEASSPGQWVNVTLTLGLNPLPSHGGGPLSAALAAADKRRGEMWEIVTRAIDGERHMFARWSPTGCCPECGRRLEKRS